MIKEKAFAYDFPKDGYLKWQLKRFPSRSKWYENNGCHGNAICIWDSFLHKELLARVVVSGVECTNYKILTRYMSSFCSRGGLTKREMALPVSSWRLLHMEANTRTKLISRLPIHIFKGAGNITVCGTYEFGRTTSNCFMTPYRGDRQHCRRGGYAFEMSQRAIWSNAAYRSTICYFEAYYCEAPWPSSRQQEFITNRQGQTIISNSECSDSRLVKFQSIKHHVSMRFRVNPETVLAIKLAYD